MTVININGGNFSIARKMFESKIWIKSPLYLKLWIFLLGCANHTDKEKNGVIYKRGELVTTYDKIIQSLSYYHKKKRVTPTLKQVRIMIKWLQSEGMIIVTPLQIERPTGADIGARIRAYLGIKISVLNYDTYQSDINYRDTHKDRPCVQQGHNNNNEQECINKYSLEILSYLNEKTGKHYRVTKNIIARLKDGATVEECQSVIDIKIADPYFIQNPKYLNPETLFRPSNFDRYKNESVPPKTQAAQADINACRHCGRQVPPQDRTADGCIYCENKTAEARA